MRKAILVVSFGTSFNETREKTIDAIENDIKNQYPDYKIYRAFTSKMIINKLKAKYNYHVDTCFAIPVIFCTRSNVFLNLFNFGEGIIIK